MPGVTFFKPAGVPMKILQETHLTVEEAEALRLKDLEGMEQEPAAEKMNVSRPTFQRILASARRKVSDAILNGKAIRIAGGNFEMEANWRPCRRRQERGRPAGSRAGDAAPPTGAPASSRVTNRNQLDTD
jgi:predicted DNA-binding protein (UPF0251 family)